MDKVGELVHGQDPHSGGGVWHADMPWGLYSRVELVRVQNWEGLLVYPEV